MYSSAFLLLLVVLRFARAGRKSESGRLWGKTAWRCWAGSGRYRRHASKCRGRQKKFYRISRYLHSLMRVLPRLNAETSDALRGAKNTLELSKLPGLAAFPDLNPEQWRCSLAAELAAAPALSIQPPVRDRKPTAWRNRSDSPFPFRPRTRRLTRLSGRQVIGPLIYKTLR